MEVGTSSRHECGRRREVDSVENALAVPPMPSRGGNLVYVKDDSVTQRQGRPGRIPGSEGRRPDLSVQINVEIVSGDLQGKAMWYTWQKSSVNSDSSAMMMPVEWICSPVAEATETAVEAVKRKRQPPRPVTEAEVRMKTGLD